MLWGPWVASVVTLSTWSSCQHVDTADKDGLTSTGRAILSTWVFLSSYFMTCPPYFMTWRVQQDPVPNGQQQIHGHLFHGQVLYLCQAHIVSKEMIFQRYFKSSLQGLALRLYLPPLWSRTRACHKVHTVFFFFVQQISSTPDSQLHLYLTSIYIYIK